MRFAGFLLAMGWYCALLVGCASEPDAAPGGGAGYPGQVGGAGASAPLDSGRPANPGPDPGTAGQGGGGSGGTPGTAGEGGFAQDAAGGQETDSSIGGAPPVDAAVAQDAETDAATNGTSCPPLGDYELAEELYLSDIPAEASGIAWNWESGTFFIAANLQVRIWEYQADLQTLKRSMTLTDMDTDTEGVAYLGDGWIAVAAENNLIYVVRVDQTTTSISGSSGPAQVYRPSPPPPRVNAGFEGVAYRRPGSALAGRIFTCQEYSPMRMLQFDHSPGVPPFSEKSYLDGTLAVEEPWDAEQTLSSLVGDVSGMTYDESNDTLLIVSQESSLVIRVDPATGTVSETLSLPNTTTSEGITLFDGCRLAIVSEPNRVQVFDPPAR
jgi:uncharacterized protein YjiK